MKRLLKDALWADCETDLERADFLRMGRGWDTGIIASSLQHEFAMAFEFRGQIMKDRASPPAPDPRDELIQEMGEALKMIVRDWDYRYEPGNVNMAVRMALSAYQKFKEQVK